MNQTEPYIDSFIQNNFFLLYIKRSKLQGGIHSLGQLIDYTEKLELFE